MSNSVRFQCTALAGTNKAGILRKDEKGYREVVVGALNVFNSAGQYYTFEHAKGLFENSSQLQRRVTKGNLFTELGHPKKLPGMTDDDFTRRILQIDEGNICGHIRSVDLDFNRVKDEHGKPVIAMLAWVGPSGPHGLALERSFDNPDENVCFSIRAFTDDYRHGGIVHRHLKTIVTWDKVTEPGISVANKWMAPSLEELTSVLMSRGELSRAVEPSEVHGVATETALITSHDLFRAMNWDDSRFQKPLYLDWN